MAEINQKILLISILTVIFLHQFIPTVRPADPAIQSVCERTPEPSYCHQCLDSSGSTKKDLNSLAGLTILCTEAQSQVLRDVLDRLSRTTHRPDVGKCLSIFGDARLTVSHAMDSWIARRFQEAAQKLGEAKGLHHMCLDALDPKNMPPGLAPELFKFRAYDDNARSLVLQIRM